MPTKSGIIGTVKLKMKDGTFVDLPDPISLEEITTFAEQYEFVKVVRCGECRNYDPYTSGLSLGRGWCDALDTEVHDGFFCADGERKGEE